MQAGRSETCPCCDQSARTPCFATDRQRNLERDPVRQRMENRGGEGNCKGVANRLRKIRRVPAERIPLTPCPEHAKPRSNASFETKHHPPAAFQELPSFTKRRPMNAILREQIAQTGCVCCRGSRVGCAWANAGDTPAATSLRPGLARPLRSV